MAHYAILDEKNIVTQVIVGEDETQPVPEPHSDWESYYSQMTGGNCLLTSEKTLANQHLSGGDAFRGNYAGVGFEYIPELNIFMPPKPYESWVLNETTASWIAPVPVPEDEEKYMWNEQEKNWVIMETLLNS